ncbi:MAG: hypothetical protein CM15mP38_1170 [Synechococcus sp.]|nr:MAG: hypothetical protein CM15mP38_1170 [Synechococcus sp.]
MGVIGGGNAGRAGDPSARWSSPGTDVARQHLAHGRSGSFESTARNKYCALIIDEPTNGDLPHQLSVVFNVGKLVGPPIGGWLVALTGPSWALGIDAASYLLPIATVLFLLHPDRDREQRSNDGEQGAC